MIKPIGPRKRPNQNPAPDAFFRAASAEPITPEETSAANRTVTQTTTEAVGVFMLCPLRS